MAWQTKTTVFGMPLFCIGQSAYGFIAIGQIARGFISIGQLSIGVLSLGQVGLGVISFNQAGLAVIDFSVNAGLGLITFALAGIGIIFCYGMAALGFISNKVGFYHFIYNTPHSEAETFMDGITFVMKDIAQNPGPMIIWCTLWAIALYIGYHKVKGLFINKKS